MRILIVGYSSSGKSTAAEAAVEIIGGKFCNESDYIIKDYAAENNLLESQVKENKCNLRQELFEFARTRQKLDPTYPVKLAFADGATVVTGTRNPDEIAAKRSMYDLIIWVDRPNWQAGPTDKLTPECADEYIMADSVKELQEKIKTLLRQYV